MIATTQGAIRAALLTQGRAGRTAWISALAACLIITTADPSPGAWMEEGNRLGRAPGSQVGVTLSSDGNGGAFCGWVQSRPDVFLQPDTNQVHVGRIVASGQTAAGWPEGGVPVDADFFAGQSSARLVQSSSGDVYVGWNIFPGSDLVPRGARVQLLRSWGGRAEGWPEGGLALGRNNARLFGLSIDTAGAAFAAWDEFSESETDRDVGAQRLVPGPDPSLAWGAYGTRVDSTLRDDIRPAIAPDGLGGAYVAWHVSLEGRVLARRIDATGAFATEWPGEAVVLGRNGGRSEGVTITTDCSNGAYVSWSDASFPFPDDQAGDIYLSRLVPEGGVSPAFPPEGLPVCRAPLRQFAPQLTVVDQHAVVVWADYRDSISYDLYMQRITPLGQLAPGWPVDGLPIVRAVGEQTEPAIVPDDSGGVLIAWRDQRSDLGDVYVQRLDASGEVSNGWPESGVRVCGAAGRQFGIAMASDGAGGAYIGWTDNRDSDATGVYLARVTSSGLTGAGIPAAAAPAALRFVGAQPNPTRESQLVEFDVPATTSVTVEVYDVRGRRRRIIAAKQTFDPGRRGVTWDGRDDFGAELPSGVYLVRVRTPEATVAGKLVLVD